MSSYRKWTNQFISECSTGFSTLPSFTKTNNYQSFNQHCQTTERQYLKEMPQDYRNYARSLTKKSAGRQVYEEKGLYEHLTKLSFIKYRHCENCCGEKKIRKIKRQHFNNSSIRQQNHKQKEIPPQSVPMLVKNIHTVQTVYVHGPPPSQILQHNNVYSQMQNSFNVQRPASAPKVSINYSNHPINTNILAQSSFKPINQFNQTSIKPINQLTTNSIVNQPRIQPLPRQQKLVTINVISPKKISEKNQSEQQSIFHGFSSRISRLTDQNTLQKGKQSGRSFQIQSALMKRSDALAYTFKQVEEYDE